MSRSHKSWQAFVHRALCFEQYEEFYHGVCVMDKYQHVVYSHGCFVDDQICIGSSKYPINPMQFRIAFNQFTKYEIMNERLEITQQNHSKGPNVAINMVPSIYFGNEVFHIIETSFTTICAVNSGKHCGLIIKQLSFGTLVVLFQHPNTIQQVLPIVDRCCCAFR